MLERVIAPGNVVVLDEPLLFEFGVGAHLKLLAGICRGLGHNYLFLRAFSLL